MSDRVYVMSARPGRITSIIDVPLPRPRRLDMMRSPNFSNASIAFGWAFRPRAGRDRDGIWQPVEAY